MAAVSDWRLDSNNKSQVIILTLHGPAVQVDHLTIKH